MKKLLQGNGAEALVGLLVVLFAAWFVLFAWQRTGGGMRSGMIRVTALFPNAVGVNPGTDVRVAGVKVGSVTEQKLEPQSFQVALTLALDPTVKLPSDSSAVITSEGLLGGTYVGLVPGGATTALKTGDTIIDTQGSVDLMSLVGQFINKSGSGGSAPSAATPPPSTPAP